MIKRLRCVGWMVMVGCFAIANAQELSGGGTVTDTSKAKVVVQESVKKQVSVPKPKTNWSKIKELFM